MPEPVVVVVVPDPLLHDTTTNPAAMRKESKRSDLATTANEYRECSFFMDSSGKGRYGGGDPRQSIEVQGMVRS
jgi:hypothetical protein